MATLPIILQLIGERAVREGVRNFEKDVKNTGATLDKTSKYAGRLDRATAAAARNGARGLNTMGDKLKGVRDRMDENAKIGLAGAAASWGLGALTSNAIQSGDEAEAAGLKLEAMLAKRGQSGSLDEIKNLGAEMSKISGIDDDKIAEVAAQLLGFGVSAEQIKGIMPGLIGQSRLYNQDLGQTAMAFGKAFASGNAGALKKVGVTLSDADVNAVKAAKSISETAGQMELFKRVQESMKNYALNVGGGQSQAQLTRAYAGVQLGNDLEAIGQAAGRARAAWQGTLLTPLAERVAASPGLTNAAGVGLEAATQLAPIMTFMATAGQSLPAWEKLGDAAKGLSQAGPLAARGLAWARAGLAAESVAAFINGDANLVAAGKLRIAGLTSAAGLATAGLALGAIALSVNDIINSAKDMHLTDEEYAKKRGKRGEIELDAARGANIVEDLFTRRTAKSNNLDKAIADQIAKNKKKFGNRKNTDVEVAKVVAAPVVDAHKAMADAAAKATATMPAGLSRVQTDTYEHLQDNLKKAQSKGKGVENAQYALRKFEDGLLDKADSQASAAQKKKAAQAERAVKAAEKAHTVRAPRIAEAYADAMPGMGAGNIGDFHANNLIIGGKITGGAEAAMKVAATAAKKTTTDWFATASRAQIAAFYTKEAATSLASLGQQAARDMIARRKANFEGAGGFENEVQMDAYEAAYKKKFGGAEKAQAAEFLRQAMTVAFSRTLGAQMPEPVDRDGLTASQRADRVVAQTSGPRRQRDGGQQTTLSIRVLPSRADRALAAFE